MAKRPRKTIRAPELAPTLGPLVCRWIERYLVHAEGDYFGQPFRMTKWQKAFTWRAYELKPDGSRKYDRALLGIAKGGGKTELGAAFGLVETAGPVAFGGWRKDGTPIGIPRTAPDVPIAAASFEQADLLFGAARQMVENGPLAAVCESYDTEILLKGRPGRMYRVAAAAGTNDGKRPSFVLADELHEWIGPKERVHLVLSNGRMKRKDSWELSISTAGWDVQSLLGRLCKQGKHILAGEEPENGLLFVWFEADPSLDLADPEQLKEAIRQANPAVDEFVSIEGILARFHEIPEHEFRRYYLNQWTSAPERWIPPDLWEAAIRTEPPPEDVPIVIGFDGSYSGDSTAVVAATVEERPHLFVIDAWEKDETKDWHVDIPDVEQTVRNTCAARQVKQVGCDPHRWQRSLAALEAEGLPIISWPSHSALVMSPACQEFERAVKTAAMTHDGDGRLTRHINNAVVKIDSRGPRIVKEHKDSPRKIDLAVAAVIAHDLAIRQLHAAGDNAWGPADGFKAIDSSGNARVQIATEGKDNFIPLGGYY